MAQTVGEFAIARLGAWGVKRIFGYSGDGINGLVAAIDRAGDAIDYIQVRHEEMAAFMACAHAKFTGELGVALATSGPGAIHLLNGLYDAKADHVPVLAIVGQVATTAIGGDYQQEVDLHALFKDVASDYLVTVTNPAQMRHAIDRAVRIALAHRTVTAIIVPKDVQEEAAVAKPPHTHNTVHSGVGYERGRAIPTEASLARAAEILSAGERVAMLVGAGAAGAEAEIVRVADALGAGCAKALLGKAVLPDDYPWVTGTLGLLGTKASADMMRACDTLLLVGTSFPYAEFLPEEGRARTVQIEIEPSRTSIRTAVDVNLVGDAAQTLTALAPLLRGKADASWRAKLASLRAEDDETNARRAELSASPINPELVMHVLDSRLPDRAIVACDAGTTTNFAARHLHMRRDMKFSLSGGLATMGSAVPYAIAAKFAFPDRIALALTGDGAMQMNGLNELITIGRYWRRWSDPRLVIMVSNNRDLNQVTWELRVQSGAPDFPAAQHLPDFPYARYAELLGFVGVKVERPEDLGAAWDRVLGADRPAVLEIPTDPNHQLIPPHVTIEQAKSYASALLRGDPEGLGSLSQSLKSLVAGLAGGHPETHS